MKRTIALFASVLLAAGLFSGCSGKAEESGAADAAIRIKEELSLEGLMVFSSEGENSVCDETELFPSFNDDEYLGYSVAAAVCGGELCEFGVFEAGDEESAAKTAEMIADRLESLRRSCDGCFPDSYEIACSAEIRTQGRFVYYSATGANDGVFSVIEEVI